MRISDWSSDVCSSDLLRQCEAQIGFDPFIARQHAMRLLQVMQRFGKAFLQQPGIAPVGENFPRIGARCKPAGIGRFRSLPVRSEEHTSELQSLMRISYAVFCLKKKNTFSLPTDYIEISIA